MEILLIGNGFDLEHKLPTSYIDFLRFCEHIRKIYFYNESETVQEYKTENLDTWEINSYIKDLLFETFQNRICTERKQKDDSYIVEISTPNQMLNELNSLLHDNTWLDYFLNCYSYIGENWIDFESEISNVIQALDSGRFQIENGGSIKNVEGHDGELLVSIWKASKKNMQQIYKDVNAIDKFVDFLNKELERLIRALEIYLSGIVHNIPVDNKSPDVEKIHPDHILSFNYSDTYTRVYGKGEHIEYNYIHGKAELSKTLETCNMVLGIDEYLDEDEKDSELTFLFFKKYYQRIYKSTDNVYLLWIDEIRQEYIDYVAKTGFECTSKYKPFRSTSLQERIHIKTPQYRYPEHNLYIFGHSLDVTDKDVLKKLICNDNVQTKIFYYRKHENDKSSLAKLIKNLIKIMGQDELIRRTGGVYQTIEFIPQTIIK